MIKQLSLSKLYSVTEFCCSCQATETSQCTVQPSQNQQQQETTPVVKDPPSTSSPLTTSPSPFMMMSDFPVTPRSVNHPALGSTGIDGTNAVFQSKTDFISYISEHPKSKHSMREISAGMFTIKARRAITQVTVSKLIDYYGYNVSSAVKEKVSSWLADITNMKTSDFFYKKTHTGFLNKDLHNRRRKLPPCEKRWVWSKKTTFASSKYEAIAVTEMGQASESTASAEQLLMDVEGCPRSVTDCDICGGLYFIIIYYSLCMF
jgi:hypothetical protein